MPGWRLDYIYTKNEAHECYAGYKYYAAKDLFKTYVNISDGALNTNTI